MLKKDNFVKCNVMMKKSNKKCNKTFTALFLLWIGNSNIVQVSLLRWSLSFLNTPTLRLWIIILLNDWPEIILPTIITTNNWVGFALWLTVKYKPPDTSYKVCKKYIKSKLIKVIEHSKDLTWNFGISIYCYFT